MTPDKTPTRRSIPAPAAPATASVPAAPVDAGVDIHELAAASPPSSVEEVREILGELSDDELVAKGRKVDTAAISAEGATILAAALRFFAGASADDRDAIDLTVDTVHAAVWSCAQGDRAFTALREGRAARRAAVRGRVTSGKAALERAAAECGRLADSLKKVAPGDDVAQEHITAALRPKAEGLADTGDGQRLASLVAVGRELVGRDDATRARAARWKVTPARLDACAALADEAVAAARYDATPALGDDARAQAEVDRWDGINVRLLTFIVRAFHHGHRVRSSVPKLAVMRLRSAMGLDPVKKKAAKPATPPTP
ncbi:MAG: hypothetical protein U0324_47465 [Polyangiales bacterium]